MIYFLVTLIVTSVFSVVLGFFSTFIFVIAVNMTDISL